MELPETCANFVEDPCITDDVGEPKGQCANCGAKEWEHSEAARRPKTGVDINYSYLEKIRARLEPCKHRSFRTSEEADACELLLAYDIATRRIVQLERQVFDLESKLGWHDK